MPSRQGSFSSDLAPLLSRKRLGPSFATLQAALAPERDRSWIFPFARIDRLDLASRLTDELSG